jgi:hypothetical protein
MKHSIGALFAFITGASLLTACGPGTTSLPPVTGNSCGGPPVQLEVLFPRPNARRAPGNLGNVYVSTNGQLPNNNQYNFFLKQSNGSSTGTSPFFGISKSEIPMPHATPSYPNPVYYASSIPNNYLIGPSQAVSLYWNVFGTGCTPRFLVSSFQTR